MAKHLLCIDPGLLTGVTLLELPDRLPAVTVRYFEVAGKPEYVLEALSYMGQLADVQAAPETTDLTVVMEDWDSRKLKFVPDARHACYPAGMVQMWAFQQGVKVVMRRPGARIKVDGSQKVLEPLGWWIPGSKGNKTGLQGHAREAERHGLSYAIHKLNHMPTTLHYQPRTV